MQDMSETIANKLQSYPTDVQKNLSRIRQAIFEVADELGIARVEETLKWGELSYLVKGGSTLRIDWKGDKDKPYGLYFNCNSKLVDTFKELFKDTLCYEGNRAIVFDEQHFISPQQLKICISLTFRYHKIKHLPLLGL